MNSLIKSIIGDLVEKMRSEKNLLSLSLAGSFSNPEKKFENFNDLDFVIIYNKITSKDLANLNKLANFLKNKYASRDIKVSYTFKIGPIKTSSKKQRSILLHFLVYSKEDYLKYESVPTRYSFQHYPPLLGTSLQKINNFSSVISIDIFNDIDGIPAIKQWIEKKEISYLEPMAGRVKFTNTLLKGDLYLEVIFYGVLWLTNNLLRLKGEYHPDTDLNMCKSFNKNFPIKLSMFPTKVYHYKKEFRMRRRFSNEEIKKIKEDSLKFISQCESYLRTNTINNYFYTKIKK